MEPVDQRPNSNETPAGSFGLGAALAVAYDLIEDPSFPCVYSEAGGSAATGYNAVQSPFTTVLTPPNQTGGFLLTNASSDRLKTAGYYSLPVAAVSQSQQPIQQQPNRYPLPAWNTAATATTTSTLQPFWVSDRTTGMSSVYSAAGPPMTAYLNPIPTTPGLQTSSEAPPCSTSASTLSPSVSVPSSASLYYSTDISTQHSYLGNGPASESTLSTDSLISNRSDSYNSDGYTLKPIPCPAAAVVPSAATGSVPSSSPVPRKSNHPDAHKHSNGPSSSSTTSDDGLYELSEEDVKEIDDMLTRNPEVTSSRHWKYYVETNEWTRATCALMACLFTRDQMANSTVLGRGGSQRERLPTNLVAYVVTKMRRRFNKSAAAVRARMAQKCKDERRFGRVLPPGCINQPSAVTSGRYSSRSPGVSSSRRRNAVGSARSQRGTGDLRASPRRNQRPPQTPPSATVSKVTGCSGSNSSNSNSSSGNGYFSSCGYGLYPPTSGGVAMPPSAPGLHVSSPHPVHMVSSPPALGVHDPPVILASATEMAG